MTTVPAVASIDMKSVTNWRREVISSIIYTAISAVVLFVLFMFFGSIHDHGGWLLSVLFAPMGLISLIFGRTTETGWTFFFAVELGSLFILVMATRLIWRRVFN